MAKSNQFAEADKLTSSIQVKLDKYGNEIPADKPMHKDATGHEGDFHWNGNQYSTDFNGGLDKYGEVVKNDAGQHPKVERILVDAGCNRRGEES